MFQFVIDFFATKPPALDPLFIPWVTALIAGNVIVFSGLWALLKYIAKLTPWAEDDKIIQIISGAYAAVKSAIPIKKKETNLGVAAPDTHCEKCGK